LRESLVDTRSVDLNRFGNNTIKTIKIKGNASKKPSAYAQALTNKTTQGANSKPMINLSSDSFVCDHEAIHELQRP